MSHRIALNNTNIYESIKVPILNASDYPTWKVKIAKFLEIRGPKYKYLDMIYTGPHKPTKLVVVISDKPENFRLLLRRRKTTLGV